MRTLSETSDGLEDQLRESGEADASWTESVLQLPYCLSSVVELHHDCEGFCDEFGETFVDVAGGGRGWRSRSTSLASLPFEVYNGSIINELSVDGRGVIRTISEMCDTTNNVEFVGRSGNKVPLGYRSSAPSAIRTSCTYPRIFFFCFNQRFNLHSIVLQFKKKMQEIWIMRRKLGINRLDYGCEDGRFPVSASSVTIANLDSLS
jgi:hypothetical protein